MATGSQSTPVDDPDAPSETTPLQEASVYETTIAKSESVYTFMIYIAPLERKRYGHFMTHTTFLAFGLFALNVVLQVTLTFIAGSSILESQKSFVETLVDDKVAAVDLDHLADKQWGNVRGMFKKEDISTKCCPDASCYNTGVICCKKGTGTSHRAHTHKLRPHHRANRTEESLIQALRGPHGSGGGGKGKKENDEDAVEQVSQALCHRETKTGEIDCSPMSAAFVEYWDKLDVNKDGIWSLKEAQEDEANLGCQLGVPTEDIFRSACRGIEVDTKDSREFALPGVKIAHPPKSVRDRRAIPLGFFRWWAGLVAICSSSDMAQCGKLVAEGIFDGTLNPSNGRVRGGVRDLNTAMSYCTRLLRTGGICEEVMPGTYVLYHARVKEKCGGPIYSPGPRIANPYDPHDVMGTVSVTFETQETYNALSSPAFAFFLVLVIIMWFTNLTEECKDIINLADMCWNFPVDNIFPFMHPNTAHRMSVQLGSWVGTPEPELDMGAKDIASISRPHHMTLLCMLMVRGILVTYMAYVGTLFLLMNHTYLDLLLNAVALAFVFDIDDFLYVQLVSEETKEELDGVNPIRFHSSQPNWWILRKQVFGLLIVPIAAFIIVYLNEKYRQQPILEALRCMCEHEGEHCKDATSFDRHWWTRYWKETALLISHV